MIIPIYKKCGQSSHQLAKQLGDLRAEKATHTGTLDPVAEGVLVVLTGEDRFRKSELSGGSKIYQAEILLGIGTDTDDELGLIQAVQAVSKKDQEFFLSQLLKYVGKHDQPIHPFSSKRIQGQSYFDLAKAGKDTPIYTQSITVESITLINQTLIHKKALLQRQTRLIDQITGDFRQEEIKKSWQNQLKSSDQLSSFYVLSVQIKCSKRTYIRSLIKEVSKQTGVPATLHSLIRTQNGEYSIADCICLSPPSVSVAEGLRAPVEA